MTTSPSDIISEAIAFARLKQNSATNLSEAKCELRPARSFFEILRAGNSLESRVQAYRATVQDVVERRRSLLDAASSALSCDAYDGKVLATDLSSTMYDGVAGELTGGYFDHADAPPPETWLGVVSESVDSPGYNGLIYLLSWIDRANVERVNVGIETTPSGCLSWVEDWRNWGEVFAVGTGAE